MRKQEFTPEQVIEALELTEGLQFLAAQLLGCTPQTIINYRKRYPEVAAAFSNGKGLMGDTAESKLYEAIKRGEAWAICFYLKTQCRDRGYVEKSEVVQETKVTISGEDSALPRGRDALLQRARTLFEQVANSSQN